MQISSWTYLFKIYIYIYIYIMKRECSAIIKEKKCCVSSVIWIFTAKWKAQNEYPLIVLILIFLPRIVECSFFFIHDPEQIWRMFSWKPVLGDFISVKIGLPDE